METTFPYPKVGHQGFTLVPNLEVGHTGEYLMSQLSPIEPGRAQPKEEMRITTCGPKGWVKSGMCGDQRQEPWQSDPWLEKLALGTWNITSLVGKELELVCEVYRFRLKIVQPTLMHG